MRFLVLQHIACDHPAIFRKFLAADCISWDAVSLDTGQTIPSLEGYDALCGHGRAQWTFGTLRITPG